MKHKKKSPITPVNIGEYCLAEKKPEKTPEKKDKKPPNDRRKPRRNNRRDQNQGYRGNRRNYGRDSQDRREYGRDRQDGRQYGRGRQEYGRRSRGPRNIRYGTKFCGECRACEFWIKAKFGRFRCENSYLPFEILEFRRDGNNDQITEIVLNLLV